MAVVYQDKSDKLEDQDAPKQVTGTSDLSSSGTNASQGSAPGVSAPTSSGRFTNLNNYLQANTNYNAQGGGVAGQVASGLESQGKSLAAGLNADQQDFGTKAQASRVQYDPQFTQNTLQDPTKVVADPNALSQWNRQLSGQYQGPKALQNQSILQNQAQDYQTRADQTGSEGGRFQLLSSTFNNPSYSSGQQQLDNLFLQAQPSQQSILSGARSNAISSGNQVNQAALEASQKAQNYGQEASATNQSTKQNLLGAYDQFNTGLNTTVQDAKTSDQNIQNTYQSYLQNLRDRTLPQELMEQLHLTQGQRIYNVDPTQFLTASMGSGGATRQNVATPEQAAQLAALSQLGGSTVPNIVNDLDPNAAGKYEAAGLNFNATGLLKAISDARNAYDTGSVINQGYTDAPTPGFSRPLFGTWEPLSQGKNLTDVQNEIQSIQGTMNAEPIQTVEQILGPQQVETTRFGTLEKIPYSPMQMDYANRLIAHQTQSRTGYQNAVNKLNTAISNYQNRTGFNNLVNYLQSSKPAKTYGPK